MIGYKIVCYVIHELREIKISHALLHETIFNDQSLRKLFRRNKYISKFIIGFII